MSSRGTAATGRAIAGVARTKAAETSMILDIDGFLLTVGVPRRSITAAPIPPRVDRAMERRPTLLSFGLELTAQRQSKDPGSAKALLLVRARLYSAVTTLNRGGNTVTSGKSG